ncbi:MAG: type II secretion system F family protein [Alphaproteobacteria bacterium]
MTIILAGIVMTVVSLILGVGMLLGGGQKRQADQRISAIKDRMRRREAVDETSDVRLSRSDSSVQFLDRLIKTVLPHPETLRARLERTGKRISIGEYLLTSLVSGVVFGLLANVALGLSILLSILAFAFGALVLPHMMVGRMGEKRKQKFNALFPEAIDLIVRGLRSGLPVTESIKVVSQELAAPVGTEFQSVVDGIGFGKSLEDAMWDVAQRINTPDFKFFIVALSVQRETGGNLAETLENLSDVLRGRRQMKLKIRALSAEPKYSAGILGALPFIMFGLIAAINFEYIVPLFTDSRGNMLIGLGLLSQGIGVAVMVRMVRFEI